MIVKTYTQFLGDVQRTGREMLRLSRDYSADVAAFDCYTLPQFYNLVKSLTYKKDPPGIEHISRPAAILSKKSRYRDCDDKAVTVAAYLIRKNRKARNGREIIPWRFVASALGGKKLSHVFVEAMIDGRARVLDATYPRNILFAEKPYTSYQPLTSWQING